MFKNVASQKVAVYAWDSTNSVPKTGDAANITAYISKDGGAAAQSNDVNPTELDATNFKGWYLFDATQAETNCDLFGISPVSATADIEIEPMLIYTNPPNFTALGIESDGDLTKCNLVDTTTTNTDMYSSTMRGTDNAATEAKQDIIDTNVDSVLVDTATTIPALIAALNNLSSADVLTTALTESYGSAAAARTLTQLLYEIKSLLTNFSISGTTITSKKIDGSTSAKTYTLDDATSPTSLTEAT